MKYLPPPLPGDVTRDVVSEPDTELVLSKGGEGQGIRQDMHAEPRKGGGLLALLQCFKLEGLYQSPTMGLWYPGPSSEEFGSTRETDRRCQRGLGQGLHLFSCVEPQGGWYRI